MSRKKSVVETYAMANLLLFIIFLVIVKFIGLIYPPIAGGYFILFVSIGAVFLYKNKGRYLE